jgi:hypothetical protein
VIGAELLACELECRMAKIVRVTMLVFGLLVVTNCQGNRLGGHAPAYHGR